MTVITCGLSAGAFWGQIKAHAATRNIVPAHRPPVADLSVINICSPFDVRNICSCPQVANAGLSAAVYGGQDDISRTSKGEQMLIPLKSATGGRFECD